MKLNLKLTISFTLLFILVPFILIFPLYEMSNHAQPTPNKDKLSCNASVKNTIPRVNKSESFNNSLPIIHKNKDIVIPKCFESSHKPFLIQN